MKSAVIVFPGINRERDMARALKLISGREPDMVWHADTTLPLGTDLVVIPGGFSYGDYLRCGAIAARAPIMNAVRTHAADGGLVLGQVPYTIDTSASGLTQSNAAPIVLQAPASGGQGIADGQKFTITKGNGTPVTFEFDNNVVVEPGNIRVSFTLFNTQNDIAAASHDTEVDMFATGSCVTSVIGNVDRHHGAGHVQRVIDMRGHITLEYVDLGIGARRIAETADDEIFTIVSDIDVHGAFSPDSA